MALGVGWSRYDAANAGIPGFPLVWRALSGKAHGGGRADLDGVAIYYETLARDRPFSCCTAAWA